MKFVNGGTGDMLLDKGKLVEFTIFHSAPCSASSVFTFLKEGFQLV